MTINIDKLPFSIKSNPKALGAILLSDKYLDLKAKCKLLEAENTRLKFLVTTARHELFKKKLITFDEVDSWKV